MNDRIDEHPPQPFERLRDGLTRALPGLSKEDAHAARELEVRLATVGALPRGEAEALELDVRRFCFLRGLSDTLSQGGRPHPYDFRRRFCENGLPADTAPDELAADPTGWTLLGYDIGYPLGVPASVLTAKSPWIEYFARYGFNVFTYKTVRSERHDELPFPNWVYLENLDSPLPLNTRPEQVTAQGNPTTYLSRVDSYSTANSFGVPSTEPAEWQRDVAAILGSLPAGKLLIVSVMGSHEKYTGQEFVADFVRVARYAAEAGAPAIELNLSCPNKVHPGGGMMSPICEKPEATREIVRAVREEIGDAIPLVAKLGYLSYSALERLVPLIADDVRGISGINTLQVPVVDPATGRPTFEGQQTGRTVVRSAAGLSGVALRHFALDFVASLNRLRRANCWTFDILAMGGVMDAHDVRALMAAGADSVQTATAAATNPALPLDMRRAGLTRDDEDIDDIRAAVLRSDGTLRRADEVAEALDLAPAAVTSCSRNRYDLPRFVAELVALRRGIGDGKAMTGRFIARARHRQLLDGSVTLAEASRRLGTGVDEVRRLIESGELIGLGEGSALHIPVWQLTGETPAAIVDGAASLIGSFPGGGEALTAWISRPHADLAGRTPLEALLSGEGERVVAICRAIAAAGR